MTRPKARKTEKKHPNTLGLILEIIIISIGIILILDGIFSILLQYEVESESEDLFLIFHYGRIIRTTFGFILIAIGFIALRNNLKGGIKSIK